LVTVAVNVGLVAIDVAGAVCGEHGLNNGLMHDSKPASRLIVNSNTDEGDDLVSGL
jgi:hypothetical protein